MTMRPLALCFAGLALVTGATEPSASGWRTDGLPVIARTGQQLPIAVHPDGAGGLYAFWQNDLPLGVYGIHITSTGDPAGGWPAEGRSIPVGSSSLMTAPDHAGGFYMVWDDANSHLIAQRLDSEGSPMWSASGVEVCPAGGHEGGQILVDDGGALVVAWLDTRNSPPPTGPYEKYHPILDVYAQKLDPFGQLQWDSAGVAVCTDSSDQSMLRIVGDDHGGSFLIWTDSRGWLDADHLRMKCMQHFDESGRPLLARDGVGVGDIRGGIMASDGEGGVLIASYDGRNGPGDDSYVQRVDASGTRLWGVGGVPLSTAIYDQRVWTLVPDGAGGAVVAWHDLRNGHDWDIYAQRITALGEVAPGWPAGGLAVSTSSGDQVGPAAVPDGTGGCIVAWFDLRSPDHGYDVYAQRILGNGRIAAGWTDGGIALCTAMGNQVDPSPIIDGKGGAIVAWGDYRAYADIYAQHISGAGTVGDDATTPTLAALIESSAGTGGVRLRWMMQGGPTPAIMVERRETSDGWRPLGEPRIETDGELAMEDHDVVPGRRYGYRLAWTEPSGERASAGEAWVSIPVLPTLAIRGAAPNPTRGPVDVSFSLANDHPAMLECLDVNGRLAMRREVGSLGSGEHVIRLDAGAAWHVGIYFVRLTQDGSSRVARAVVMN
jgi:hypothetical protein